LTIVVAKDYLEKNFNISVIGGWLAPSGDGYAKGKLGQDYIPGEDRVKMVQLATEDSDWLTVCPWDATMKGTH
jgi:hypothetical protein